ncbi:MULTISPECIES: DUF1259 domain-containing protein [Streptomyces]|uniref:DUF1259 domain-containing protein n=1 Tax=Streptomyces morookaense TaxID=1970 RepID=A0A7Y7EAG5_STRMO|nr:MULTISPECIES: DUF1259 domain-containing protein [Streptomyces]MCC2280416.1 DUF1259 domain-containing protein [Streptomyces sp. ET3-23]NVK81494.1 DUF1259 domain-containing protein [Streptomyces morookaense]GHF24405.1 hypothetical protein GCM10010359_28330 [Streptomyces morookaense]
MFRHVQTRRTRLAAGAVLVSALAVGGVGAAGTAGHTGHQGGGSEPPTKTTAADWKGLADTLGRSGTLMGDTVYRVSLPRTDLKVTSDHVDIKPGLSLGGYAAFARYKDGTMLMGDLVVTEPELQKVTDALQAAGIDQTGVHKHLLAQHPDVWWTHIHAMGDPVALAKGLKSALAATAIPSAAKPPASQPAVALDTAGIDKALGRKGTGDGGIYKITAGRQNTVTDGMHILPSAFGITTGINFQPLGGNKAAINGDFVMTKAETQKVVQALRKGHIDIVELHNHMQDEQPRLFFLHFWATGDGVTLAKALRPALDATALAPPS